MNGSHRRRRSSHVLTISRMLLLRQQRRSANRVFRRSIAIPITLLSTLKPNVTASALRLATCGVVSAFPEVVSTHYFRLPRWTHCLAPTCVSKNITVTHHNYIFLSFSTTIGRCILRILILEIYSPKIPKKTS